MEKLLGQAVSGSASFGRVEALYSAIGATIICIPFLVFAGYEYFGVARKYSATVQGTVTAAKCSPSQKKYNCALTVSYSVAGTKYSAQVSKSSSEAYQVGDSIELHYQPSDPKQVSTESASMIALLIGGITLIVLALAWVAVFFTQRSKAFAAGTGAAVIAEAL